MGLFDKKTETVKGGGQVTLPDGRSYTIARQVDVLGDSCPRPQLMTKKAMSQAMPGDVVEVLVDNSTSMEALPPMCHELQCEHLATVTADRSWRIYLRKR